MTNHKQVNLIIMKLFDETELSYKVFFDLRLLMILL